MGRLIPIRPNPQPQVTQRSPKVLPPNVPRVPEITGVRPLTECPCGRSLMPGMRFCDACGRPLSYTGQTVRLGRGTE